VKTSRRKPAARPAPILKPARPRRLVAATDDATELRAQLAEANETLRAIRSGEVDTVTVTGKGGPQVFSLQGAEHAYRVLIESMKEGALTLTTDKMILYANHGFAQMVGWPLEQITGSSFRRFLSPNDQATLKSLIKRRDQSEPNHQLQLKTASGALLSVQISVRTLGSTESGRAMIGLVVTDMTEARRIEELLRALTHRVLRVQEAERGRVALELHDHITQLLCAILFRCQALVDELSAAAGPSMHEAVKLRDMLSKTAGEVERISRNLRPGVLDQLGLVALLRATCTEHADRTGVPVTMESEAFGARLAADTELTLYRILQEALKNIEKHARARHIAVRLSKVADSVQLTIKDDGIGFDPQPRLAQRKRKGGLGVLGMRERAAYVGGTFLIKSGRGVGTEIEVRIPPGPTVAPIISAA
jgi:two-component system, NarL family, sensor kinase